jgi:hypothetical protein
MHYSVASFAFRLPLDAKLLVGRSACSCFLSFETSLNAAAKQLAYDLLLKNKNFFFSAKNGLHL